MTTINYSHTDESYCLAVKGHVPHPSGRDNIVCAAVSMLLFTLAQTLTDAAKGNGEITCQVRLQDGDAQIKAQGNVHTQFVMAMTGFRLLKERYPQLFTINANV